MLDCVRELYAMEQKSPLEDMVASTNCTVYPSSLTNGKESPNIGIGYDSKVLWLNIKDHNGAFQH